MSRRCVTRGTVLGGALCAAAALPAGAQDALPTGPITIDYSVNARQDYTDNFAFGGRSTFLTTVGPSFVIRGGSETFRVTGSGGLDAVYFSNSEAGRNRISYRLGLDTRLTRERHTLGLDFDVLRTPGFFDDPRIAGFQVTQTQRLTYSFAPTYSYAITERLSANLGAGYSQTRWDDRLGDSLFDFTSTSVNAGLQYRLTELDTVGLTASASQFDTTPNVTSSSTRSLRANWMRLWTETLTTQLAAGSTWSDTRVQRTALLCLFGGVVLPIPAAFCNPAFLQPVVIGQQTEAQVFIWNATATYRLDPRTSLSARYGRDIFPSAGGALTEREVLSFSLSHQVTERFTAGFDYSRSETAFFGVPGAGTTGPRSSSVASYTGRLTWQLDRDWSMGAGLVRTEAQFPGRAATSNAAFVTVSKTWPNNRLWP
jgi:hypothetical protein